jgi:hypothetical protein
MEGSEKSSASNNNNDDNNHSTTSSSGTSSNHDEGAQQPKVNIEPARVEVPARGGVSTHQLHNESHKRLAFKIKTTNNEHYRITHVYGFIDGGASTTIEVKRLVGPPVPACNCTLLILPC